MKDFANQIYEMSILGSMWVDPSCIDYVSDALNAQDFSDPLFGRMFSATLAAHADGVKHPAMRIASDFADDPDLAELGGRGWIFRQTESPAIIGLPDFLKEVADLAKRRRLRSELDRASNALEGDFETAVGIADSALWTAIKGRDASDMESISDTMDRVYARIDASRNRREPPGVIAADFPAWNRLTGTMERGQLIILAGRPGMGKTAVAGHIATGVAKTGKSVLFISLEMRAVEIGLRMVADSAYTQRGGPAYARLLNGDLTNAEMDSVAVAKDSIASIPLTISDNGRITSERLAAMVRRHKRRCEMRGEALGLVIVDYLQRVQTEGRHRSNYETVSEVSMAMKSIAIDNDVPVLALAQLSREVEKRDDKRPMLSDLRDSGQIEQDADSVMFLYRPEYYLMQCRPDPASAKYMQWETDLQKASNKLEIIAAKRRNGETGSDWCHFIAAHQAIRPKDFFQVRAVA